MRILSTLFCAVIYCVASPVFAASYFLPAGIGSGPFSSCSGGGPSYTCSGDINIGNNDDLTLTDDVTLIVGGKVDIGDGFTSVSGTNLITFDATGDIKVGKDSEFSGNLISDNKVELNDNVIFSGNITASGDVKIGKDSTVTGNISGDKVELEDAVNFNGDITANGDVKIGKDSTVTGNISGDKVELKGAVNFNGDITANDDVKIGKDSTVTGNISADGDIDIKKDADITGDITAGGDIDIDKDGDITGDVTAGGDLDIGKDTTVDGICTPTHPRCTGFGAPTVDSLSTSDTTPIVTGTFSSGGSAGGLSVTVDGISYTLGVNAELTNTGDTWILDLSSATPLSSGVYDVVAISVDGGGKIKSDSTTDELTITAPTIDHYAISHGGAGITCEPKTITVTAHNADHSPYTVTSDVTVTVTTNPVVDTITSSPVTIVTGQSSATFTLTETSVTIAPHIDINVDDTNSTETSGSADATDDPKLAFYDSQFQFVTNANIPPTIDINTQIGGKPSSTAPNAQSLYLRAVRTDDTTGSPVCVAALDAGTHAIDMGYQCIDSNNCSANELGVSNNLTYNAGTSTTIAHNDGATTANTLPVTLDFDASGYAPLSFLYNNVGEIALFADAYSTLSGGVINSGVSDQFVVRPFALVLDFDDGGGTYNMRQLDWGDGSLDGIPGIPGNTSYSNPTNNPQNSSVFQIAGTNFPTEITGVLWQASDDSNTDGEPDGGVNLHNNNVASQFGQESSRVVQISHSLEQPSGGNVGILTSTFANPYTNGRTEGTMNWDEVGIIDIQLALNSYLGDTTFTPSSIAQDVGRFRPANFRLPALSVFDGTFLDSCDTTFTYIGQDFYYDTKPAFVVEAISSTSNVTSNYRGVWNKLSATSFPVSVVTSDTMNALDILHTQDTINYNSTGNGVFDVAFGDDSFCYGLDVAGACVKQANAQVMPFSAGITMTLDEIDDGEVLTVIDQEFKPKFADLRFGRLSMDNTFGSELVDLAMPMYTEIFDGSNFVLNNGTFGDNCSVVNTVDLDIAPSLTGGTSDVTVVPPAANAGVFNLNLTAPGAGNTGSILIGHLPTTVDSWLKYDWDGGGIYDDDPTATATFGIYKGNDVNIYIQQTYQ